MSQSTDDSSAKRRGARLLAVLLAGAALLSAMAAPARAGIVYDFEQLNQIGLPSGNIVGRLELPSLSGSLALPLDFSYLIAGFPFGFGDVVGASWDIDFATGDFNNLILQARNPNAFPGSTPAILANLFVDPASATNSFSFNTVSQIFQIDMRLHRIVLVDDGGLLDPPATDGGDPDAVPEPATLALLGLGVAGLVARRRRQLR